uniref:Arf-GAP with coiled-coil, ANK repeat and PH domain-containing protein n=1 Tax=Salmo trutta TaxID=8032 RepID=A0A674EIB8_SALTR
MRFFKLVKLCSGMIEAGRAYVSANKLFVNGIKDLSQQCKKEEMISILFDQAQRSIKQQLHTFIKEDVRKFKETKKQFDRVREDMEIAQVKNAQAPRNKPHEVEEATSSLTLTRKCFRHLALDYVLQVRELDQLVIDSAMEKRDLEHKHATIQQRDFSYDDNKVEFNVDAPNGVVMEGYLFKRASNAFKTWNRRWFSIQNSQLVYQKRLKDALTVVVEDLRLCSVKPCEDGERRFCFEVVSPTKSCMLQAESEKLRQAWIQAVQASIASAYREISDNYYIERLDRTASPSTSSIDSASEPRGEKGGRGCEGRGESILHRVQTLPGNELCCDCSQAAPCWASINLGVLLCIECSGIHRSLGVHCSKVRSLTLDSWEPELLKLMCELGNNVINHIYEGACEELGLKKPGPSSPRQEKEAWIKAKYVERRFLKKMSVSGSLVEGERKSRDIETLSLSCMSSAAAKLRRDSLFCPDEMDNLFSYFDTGNGTRSKSDPEFPACEGESEEEESSGEVEIEQEAGSDPEEPLPPGALLYRSSRLHNLPLMAEALAHGADVHSASDEEGKTPLIQAVTGGSLIACEFLLQNGADVNQRDMRGRGPLHHATYLGHTGQVCLFLKRGACQTEVDEEGHDPLSMAVQAANADIVTLLRLARMNEEMREAEGPFGQPGQYPSSSPTEHQYRKCIQEFICLTIDYC